MPSCTCPDCMGVNAWECKSCEGRGVVQDFEYNEAAANSRQRALERKAAAFDGLVKHGIRIRCVTDHVLSNYKGQKFYCSDDNSCVHSSALVAAEMAIAEKEGAGPEEIHKILAR